MAKLLCIEVVFEALGQKQIKYASPVTTCIELKLKELCDSAHVISVKSMIQDSDIINKNHFNAVINHIKQVKSYVV
jgi:hypothetical protein